MPGNKYQSSCIGIADGPSLTHLTESFPNVASPKNGIQFARTSTRMCLHTYVYTQDTRTTKVVIVLGNIGMQLQALILDRLLVVVEACDFFLSRFAWYPFIAVCLVHTTYRSLHSSV